MIERCDGRRGSVVLLIAPVASSHEESKMLYWAAVFFVIAIIAALFGFGGIAAGATSIAQVLFGLFLLIAVISLILGLIRRT
jgi:uncharacterized membrane protein YtjA (UPF0391 family)